MNKTKISVDYNKIIGKIKPMHCGNGGPRNGGEHLKLDFSEEFRYMGIPYTRLHDIEYPYGKDQFVDIHCIFPDFDADENDPESYNFKPTDDYLKAIINTGCQVFYRLGESIDHYPKPRYIHPPKDKEKWARICEHIIMHYNEGWADGFNFEIKYWEIWTEPENDKMWTGTNSDFFELYRVTANYLKERFGCKIKVGGCAFSGFYVLNRQNPSEWFKTLVPYMHDFLSFITAEDTKAPIDFLSWHCYADTPEEVYLHSGYAEEMIKKYGLTNCESILDEFNMYYCFREFAPLKSGMFADVGASMILAQKSKIDMMMYYMFSANTRYNCAYFLNGVQRNQIIRLAGIETFADFNKLYTLGNEVKTEGDIDGKLNVLAAKGEDCGALMIVSRAFEGCLEIELSNECEYDSFSVKHTNDKNEDRTPSVFYSDKLSIENGKINLEIEEKEIVLIILNK